MKVTGDNKPSEKFTVEKQPKKPGYVLVRFFENAKEYSTTIDETKYSGWEYDEYHLELKDTGDIKADIEGNYDVFLNQAKMSESNNTDPNIDELNEKIQNVEKTTKEMESQIEQSTSMQNQLQVASMFFVKTNTTIPDDVALLMSDLFITWEEALNDGKKLENGVIINDGGQLYRVVQEGGVTPQEHQAPHDEGMLAVYRPIDTEHSGTQDDPIPFVEGMDTFNGKYYGYKGKIYLCKQDMTPCVWTPDTPGLWQWEEIK